MVLNCKNTFRTQIHIIMQVTYINTASFSTTTAGTLKGNPYNFWTMYLYTKSMFLFSFTEV